MGKRCVSEEEEKGTVEEFLAASIGPEFVVWEEIERKEVLGRGNPVICVGWNGARG